MYYIDFFYERQDMKQLLIVSMLLFLISPQVVYGESETEIVDLIMGNESLKFVWDMGRAYQFGRTLGLQGADLPSKELLMSNTFVSAYENSPVFMIELLYSIGWGYKDGFLSRDPLLLFTLPLN